ncbi:hypothetical protein JOE61_001076 [Nocardioides salarius]|uniref:SAF domain-containing protein n=1 Tax=Nocardioides salarius TaxID=374513 RepID=A0ABS2M7U3_9ACTN|nr:hypothetical protein [Nocardioides salarius]MBM7507262.1 hypothetical protein [Nocardioides salarius]
MTIDQQAAPGPGSRPAPSPSPSGVSTAVRSRRPGWRDPRLWVGVALVAGSVVLGARLLAAADDMVTVWSASSDLGVGQRLEPDDLVAQRVRFDDARAVAGYLGADDELPADATLVRPVAAGELVPAAALGSAQDSGRVELPLSVDPERLPDLGAGMTVDVYLLAPGRDADGRRIELDPGPVLADVTVVDASTPDGGFGSSGQRRVVVAVPEDDADAYVALLGRLGEPTVLVSRAR